MSSNSNKFIFLRHDTIGAGSAEQDEKFLDECFVETEDLRVLCDCSDPRQIILGRTGIGKTALIKRLEATQDRVINIPPEHLSISHISTSNVLEFLQASGVDLDVMFRLLWRHVFVVEIFRSLFDIQDEPAKQTAIQKLLAKVNIGVNAQQKAAASRRKKALDYLEEWGSTFWETTDNRIKELTSNLETNIQGKLGVTIPHVSINGEGARKLTTTEKKEVVRHTQQIVNQIQVRELLDIMTMLNEELDDPQKPYFIVIDRLDEKWVDNKVRYALIRALIETIRDFRSVSNVKIIITLRTDLLEKVLQETKQYGFQEEKYTDLYLNLTWSKRRLVEIVDTRLNRLVKQRYTRQKVDHTMLFRTNVGNSKPLDYIMQRTFERPRDVIAFVNYCIQEATNSDRITQNMIIKAEDQYSIGRLRSLGDEWSDVFPYLTRFAEFLRSRPSKFTLSDVSDADCEEFCLKETIEGFDEEDDLSLLAIGVADGDVAGHKFLTTIIEIFFKVGLVGVRFVKHSEFRWSYDGKQILNTTDIDEHTRVEIHPMFHRALGISLTKTGNNPLTGEVNRM